MKEPVVSVIMPVYNGEKYIAESMKSILSQTLTDLELIVVIESDSNESSIAEVEKFSDTRIVLVKNSEKMGLIASLNRGLEMAKGRFIARMDSDDVSLPTRLEKQVDYLSSHPEVGVLGTLVAYIDNNGSKTSVPRYFWRPETIAWDMLFNSPIPHPSAMMGRDVLTQLGGYDPNAKLVEDYDLWLRAFRVTKLENLPEHLVHIRKHGENITVARREEQKLAASKLIAPEFERLLGRPIPLADVHALRNPSTIADGATTVRVADLLGETYRSFMSARQPGKEATSEVKGYAVRLYSVLLAATIRNHWGVGNQLLDRAKEIGLSKSRILTQAMVRRALGK